MPLNVAMQQPDRDKFIAAMAREFGQHTELKHWRVIHKSQVSPEECQAHSHGVDPSAQTRPCRRNPEVEGPFVCWRPPSSIWRHLLDHICPCGIMDNRKVHFHHSLIDGVAHEID